MKSSQFIYLTQLLKERKDRKQNPKIYRDINTHKYTRIIVMKYDFFMLRYKASDSIYNKLDYFISSDFIYCMSCIQIKSSIWIFSSYCAKKIVRCNTTFVRAVCLK